MKKPKKPRLKPSRKSRPIIYNSPANLPYPNILLANAVTECIPRFIVKECKCGRGLISKACDKRTCIRCNDRLNSRRANAAFDRFQYYKKSLAMKKQSFSYCYTDFTIPPVLRQQYADPKAWQKLRLKIWHILAEQFGALFGLEATHPIGEDNPNIFHPHLNFLYVMKPGFRNYIAVERLRFVFRKALKYIGPVNLYHAYGDSDRQLMHLCKYVTRIFPAFAEWSGALRWYGRYPKYKPVKECICPICLEKIMILGSIDSQTVKSFEAHGFWMGRSPPWEDDKKITFFKKPNFD